jgi:hypothetical protein
VSRSTPDVAPRILRQPARPRSVGIHHVDVEVAARIVGFEGNEPAVRRPGRVALRRGGVRELMDVRAIGVHDEEIGRLVVALGVERDLLAIG